MRGRSVFGSVPLMGPGVSNRLCSWLAGWAQSIYTISLLVNRTPKDRQNRAGQGRAG